MPSGDNLVSTTAKTGMPSLFASATAISSLRTSIHENRIGQRFMPLMPESVLS
jgi:hypothetical protein